MSGIVITSDNHRVYKKKNPYLLAQSLEIVYFCTLSTKIRVNDYAVNP